MKSLVIFVLLSIVSCSAAPIPTTTAAVPEEVKRGEQLIEAIQDAIEAKDRKKLGGFFVDSFVFDGCGKQYSKAQSIDMIAALGSDMTRTMEKHSQIAYIGNQRFVASIQNTFITMSAEFFVSNDAKLVSGRRLSCPEKKP